MICRSIRAALAALCAAGAVLVAALVGAPAASASQVYGFGSPILLVGGATAGVNSVSCASSTYCMAVDGLGNSYTGSTSWDPPVSVSSGSSLVAVDCIPNTPGSCNAVSRAGNFYGFASGSWSPGFAGASTNPNSVSCTSASSCVIGDASGNLWLFTTGWAKEATLPAGITGVSCVAGGTFCGAVDKTGDVWTSTNSGSGFASVQTMVHGTDSSSASEISCLSTTFCAIGDNAGNVWVGAPGLLNETPVSSAAITAVSCATTTYCVAFDANNDVSVYDGTTWTTPQSVGANGNIDTVSCPTSTFCVAGSSTGYEQSYGPLALSLPTTTLPAAIGGLTYNAPLSATGGNTSYTFSVSGMPGWLTYDAASNSVYGVAPSGASGTAHFSVTVTDASNNTATATMSIPLGPATPDQIAPLVNEESANGVLTYGVPANLAQATTAQVVAGTGGWYSAGGSDIDFVPTWSGTYFGQTMTAGALYRIAGGVSASGPIPGPALGANLHDPISLSCDSSGCAFASNNGAVYFMAFTSGTYFGQSMTAGDVYTLDNSANLIAMYVALDGAGNVDVADDNGYLWVIPNASGTVLGHTTTAGTPLAVAGTGKPWGNPTSGSLASGAPLNEPAGVTVDAAGDVFVASGSGGIVSMIPAASGTYFGQAMTADHIYNVMSGLGYPDGLAVDGAGNLYVEDGGSHKLYLLPATNCASACPYGLASTTAGTSVVIGGGGANFATVSGLATNQNLSSTTGLSYDSTLGAVLLNDSARGDAIFGGPTGTAPMVTSAATANCTAGTACTFTVTASGTPMPAITESGTLPSGMTFTDNGNGTATLSGTASAAGSYPLTITATNAAGTATQSFSLTVATAPVHATVPPATTSTPSAPNSPITLPVGFGSPSSTSVSSGAPTTVSSALPHSVSTVVAVRANALPPGTTVVVAPRSGPGTPTVSTSVPSVDATVATLAVTWSDGSSTVPTPSKPVSVTITGSDLRPGDVVYAEIGGKTVPVARVTVAGQVTVQIAAAAELAVAEPPVAVAPSTHATRSAVAAGVKLACTEGALCTGPATLSVARHEGHGFRHPAVATATVHIRAGEAPVVRFTLTPFGRRLVRAHHGKAFDVTVLMHTDGGNRFAKRIVLR